MTTPDQSKGNRSRDEVLAGEYVLGVLDDNARRLVEERLRRDRVFAAVVLRWEENLSQFNDAYEDVAPPATVYAGLEESLFGARRHSMVAALWNSLPFWRGLSMAGIVGMAAFVGFQLAPGMSPQPKALTAEMVGEDKAINLLARYDDRTGRLSVTPVAAGEGAEKSLELWLIIGDEAPKSLGVLPQSGEGELVVPAVLRGSFAKGSILAVSLEPFGGSPTGQATGPVLALGAMDF